MKHLLKQHKQIL